MVLPLCGLTHWQPQIQEREMLFSFGGSATPPVGLDMQTSASFCPYMGDNSLQRGKVELSMRLCF